MTPLDKALVAFRGFLEEGDCIDIHIDDGEGVSYEITQAIKPFYVRRK